jgi:hypothetical protein
MKNHALKILGALAIIVLVAWLCIFAYQNVEIVRLDNLYETKYGYPTGRREKYFSASFPSSREVEKFLQDSTVVYSSPPRGNRVFYFARDHTYVLWFESVTNDGEWRTFPKIQILILGSRWRVAVVTVFCRSNTKMDSRTCSDVENVESILTERVGSVADYYRQGNVFDLSPNKKRAPFLLPSSEITIDSLVTRFRSSE